MRWHTNRCSAKLVTGALKVCEMPVREDDTDSFVDWKMNFAADHAHQVSSAHMDPTSPLSSIAVTTLGIPRRCTVRLVWIQLHGSQPQFRRDIIPRVVKIFTTGRDGSRRSALSATIASLGKEYDVLLESTVGQRVFPHLNAVEIVMPVTFVRKEAGWRIKISAVLTMVFDHRAKCSSVMVRQC